MLRRCFVPLLLGLACLSLSASTVAGRGRFQDEAGSRGVLVRR